jgi:striatin 1/3/4
MYLGKCSQEITYHVIPAAHPPPSLDDPPELTNHVYPNQQMPQQSLEEAYVQQRQKQQQNNIPMVREPVVQNHQPMLSTNFENQAMSRSNNQHHPLSTSRGMERHNYDQHPPPLTAIDGRKPFELPSSSDEQVESISHSYDSHGKIISGKREVESIQTTEIPIPKEESEGWNFDDSPSALEAPSDEPRRDSDNFPGTIPKAPMSPPRLSPGSHRRKSSGARRRSEGGTSSQEMTRSGSQQAEPSFKVRFALRGHLDVVRTVIFTGGGSPSEPEICTSGDDGTLKRWIIPASYGSFGPHGMPQGPDLDITAYFTHRGHNGSVTSLAACPASQNFSNGGRALGDGWVFSGGQDASVRVWERGRVDPKAILDGHTDAVWALAILPGSSASILGERCGHYGGPDRILLASGGADGRILIWAVSAPPQLNSPHTGSRRGAGRRANSVSSGSNFPSSPQPSTATATPFHYTLVHHIVRADHPSPTCISPLSGIGDTFVVSYTDASILIYDTRSGEEVVGMASLETYDGTPSTGVNSVVASTMGFDATHHLDPGRGLTEDDSVVHGATGSSGGVEGVIISGYEDRYIRFFDANSGTCFHPLITPSRH